MPWCIGRATRQPEAGSTVPGLTARVTVHASPLVLVERWPFPARTPSISRHLTASLPGVAVDRVQAVRRLLMERGAEVGERTLTEILRALYTPDAINEDIRAEVRATSPTGDNITVVITAVEIRDAIRRWC